MTEEEIAAAATAEAEAAAAEAEAEAEAAKAKAKEGEGEGEGEAKKYSFGGNEYDSPEEALEAARNLESDYTKKSQRLAELEKQATPPKKEDEFDPEDEKIADQLYTILKKKHGLLTRAEVEEQKQLDNIDRTFKGLEKTYKGEDGLPKFDTNKVLKFMQENGYPPQLAEDAFKKMHEKEFLAYAVKKAVEGKGGYETESKKGAPKKVGTEKELNSKQDVEDFVMSELAKAKAGEMD